MITLHVRLRSNRRNLNFFFHFQVFANDFIENNIKTKHIFVLAGGQLKDGNVNAWVKERLDLVLSIKQNNKDAF